MEKKSAVRLALISVTAIVLLALYPQLYLWLGKGSSWKGSYAVSNYDEVAYSAYINALIEGKPRQHDPFLVEDNKGETLYSIQMVPAYAIAAPARLVGLSSSTTFILLGILIAAASALAVFGLIRQITGDDGLAAAGTLIVLCLGNVVAYQGEFRQLIEGRLLVDYFPFLRRYQPGFAFPLFFVFCGLVWRAFSDENSKRRLVFSVFSGVMFAVLVFSYFYLWTAAGAWLLCFVAILIALQKDNRTQVIASTAIIGAIGIITLVPYFIMIGNRNTNIDNVQLLTLTHMPQVTSPVLIVGLVMAAVAILAAWRGKIDPRSPASIFVLVFSLTPVVLFNQQIVTGRSLQPVHYEIFIANYLVLMALVILVWLILSQPTEGKKTASVRRVFVYLGLIAFGWGMVEAARSTSRSAGLAQIRDESVPAIEYIGEQQPQNDGPLVVHATNFVTADFIPTIANVRTLWNPHTSSAGGIGLAENKRLFYLYLYYSGFGEKDLSEALRVNSFEVTSAVFGAERALPSLGQGTEGISSQEIQSEVSKYAEFVRKFDYQTTANPVISYIIVPAEAEQNFSNLDRWYSRDTGQTFGLFKVYKLEPKAAR
ncbi:MAG: hypothetical protein ACT4O9_11720 [Blastocatellia bacterium]